MTDRLEEEEVGGIVGMVVLSVANTSAARSLSGRNDDVNVLACI